MAISVKSGVDYGYSLLPLFGVSKSLLDTAKAAGVQVEQSTPGKFNVQHGSIVYGSVVVKGSAISLAKSHTLGPASKEALKYQFETAIQKALKSVTGTSMPSGTSPASYQDTKPAKPVQSDEMDEVIGHSPVASGPAVGGVIKTNVTKFSNSGAVALNKASTIYAPVTGTSVGSVYFVLALFDGLSLAAKVQGSKLSIRVEGPLLSKYATALSEVGVVVKAGYASSHYNVASPGLMVRSLSAIIGSIGFANMRCMADIHAFIKGQA